MIRHFFVKISFLILLITTAVDVRSQQFLKTDISIEALSHGKVNWIDLNNDGLLDIFMTGNDDSGTAKTLVYMNGGNENFVMINSGIPDFSNAAVSWEDYDKDKDLDLLVSGVNDAEIVISAIYRNDLPAGFVKMNFDFINVHSGSVSWTDYNNDTRPDVFITGISVAGLVISKLYKNTGSNFTEVNAPFHSLYNSTYEFYDLDNDGDNDVLFSGQSSENKNSYVTKIYININGSFVESTNNFPPVSRGSASWGDFDADGFPDIVMNGESSSGFSLMVMHNGHNGTFNQHSITIPGIAFGKVLWADFDNDGLLDILLTGNLQGNTNGLTKIYRNDNGNFIEVNNDLPGVINGVVSAGDYDNDFKLDLILTGHDPFTNKNICAVYRNIVNAANDRPVEPKGLTTTFDNSTVNLTWLPGYDQNSPSSGLTYNIRIGTTPGGSEIISPASAGTNGFSILPGHGNSGSSLQYHISDLKSGNYYWSIQTIDNTYNTSEFSGEQTFSVSENDIRGIPIARDIILKQNYPNPFNPRTIISYQISKFKQISLKVYNAEGKELKTLIDKKQNSGNYEIEFDGSQYSSGIYFYSLQADGEFVESKRMILIK